MNYISRISFWKNIIPKRFFSRSKKRDTCNENQKCTAQPPPTAPKKPTLKTFKIYRYNPSDKKKKKPYMQSYTIDINDCRQTLEALNKIKCEQDSTLSFRKSCREGICGSCGMNIDGTNDLACQRKIKPRGTTTIYPLPHMYVVRDLVVDMKKFYQQYHRIKPYLISKVTPECEGKLQFLQGLKDRNKMNGYVECILCACCSTSCPEYWWHGHTNQPNDFLGPAALLQAYRWIMDSRDEAVKERLNMLKNYYALYRCQQINNCTFCCPKKLKPGKAIANLRLLMSGFSKKQKAEIEGMEPAQPNKAGVKPCSDN